jgi:hypothetical protein
MAEKTERSVAQKILTQTFRRQLQQVTDVQERKRPGAVIGYDPAISIAIEFPLDCARCTMEASQILTGLLENSGGQLSWARLGDVIFGRFHLVDWFVHSFLKLFRIDISETSRSLPQSLAPLLRSTKENHQGQESDQ